MKTENLSSSLTLFLKYFFPLVWFIFFGGLCLIFWTLPYLDVIQFKIGFTVFFLLGIATLYFTCMRLLRVEMDDEFVFVTNYFKIFKYPHSNIEKIEEKDFLIARIVVFHLCQKGYFGSKIVFLASRRRYRPFVQQHSDFFKTKT